jgi:hypothetical protein
VSSGALAIAQGFCNAAAFKAKQIKSNGGTDEDVRRERAVLYIQMTGSDLGRQNSGTILFHAISKGYDILDCIVDIDLCVLPPSIEVMLSADFLAADQNEETLTLRVKKTRINEARKENSLPFNYIGHFHGEGVGMVGMVDLHEAPASSACPGSVRRGPRHRRT